MLAKPHVAGLRLFAEPSHMETNHEWATVPPVLGMTTAIETVAVCPAVRERVLVGLALVAFWYEFIQSPLKPIVTLRWYCADAPVLAVM